MWKLLKYLAILFAILVGLVGTSLIDDKRKKLQDALEMITEQRLGHRRPKRVPSADDKDHNESGA